MDAATLERFMAKVQPEPMSGCWLWDGALGSHGYGQLRVRVSGRPKTLSAHRLSYEHWNGPLGALCCLHRCDTRVCVNPDHLFAGTRAENSADMVTKGRQTMGERNPMARLQRADIPTLRRLARAGWSAAALGRRFGVCSETARRAAVGESWGHVE